MSPAAFLDRDGVINVDHGYVSAWEQFEFLPGVPRAMRQLQDAGYRLIVVSNQSGIGRGLYTEADLNRLNEQISDHLKQTVGVDIAGFYHCPHHPTEARGVFLTQCDCRKPAAGMIIRAVREHGIDVEASLLVGDKRSDIEAGRAAGVARLFQVVPPEMVVAKEADVIPVTGLKHVPAML